MKIGYSVEGSTDRAIIVGLKDRWCPAAELLEGKFRGQTRVSRRREIPKICQELSEKSPDLLVMLTDSNDAAWRDVLRGEEARCPVEFQHLAVFAVCLRNSECWLSADADYIANHFGRLAAEFRVEDPKGIVESCFGITRLEKKEPEIAAFVRHAPLHHWLGNPSFEDFYQKLRGKSRELGCQIENLL
jgi:hypothetical protein